jgi:spore coat polysaccharide biosynthesis protein SpsF
MSVTAIIQARMYSSRLPGKCLMSVAGVPLLKRVIDRVGEAKRVGLTVVATCVPGDTIAGHCSEWDTPCFVSAKEFDVLGRFVEVCHKLQLRDEDLVVRVCGDNPLIRPECIDQLVDEALASGAEYTGYVLADGTPAITRPTGYFAEVARVDALRALDQRLANAREHVTAALIYQTRGTNECRWVDTPDWYTADTPNTAIDTAEDLQRVSELLENGALS